MNNKHEKRFIINMLVGLLLITTGVSCIIYAGSTDEHNKDWTFWAVISSLAINAGLLFLGSSLIHKIKADLIRRQRQNLKSEKHTINN